MVELIHDINISVWIALGALIISALSLFLSLRNSRFNKKMEAAKIRTNLIQRALLAKEAYRELRENIDEFDELNDDFPKSELDGYRQIVKEAIEVTNMINDIAEKDKVVNPVKLERWVARVEGLLIGAKRRIRETTTAIEKQTAGNHRDKPSK